MDDLDPELALLAAIFHQIELDATATDARHRADVQHWLNSGGLAWWDTFLELAGALDQHMRQRLTRDRPRTRPED